MTRDQARDGRTRINQVFATEFDTTSHEIALFPQVSKDAAAGALER